MDEKQSTLQPTKPKAVLKAMTPEARDSIPHDSLLEQDMVRICQFPFKVGRESRFRETAEKRVKFDGHERINNLYLTDTCRPRHISRKHFQIETDGSNYILIDRDSTCGMTVGITTIGGQRSGGEAKLKDGDIIAVGAKSTPYLFKFSVLKNQG
jgi:hypothetical protein